MQKRFTCCACGLVELVNGGTSGHKCRSCRAEDPTDRTRTAQYIAHQAVAKARSAGLLPSPRGMRCEDCGGAATEYDHRDYSQPLRVAAVCRGCNLRRGPAAGWLARKHLSPEILGEAVRDPAKRNMRSVKGEA